MLLVCTPYEWISDFGLKGMALRTCGDRAGRARSIYRRGVYPFRYESQEGYDTVQWAGASLLEWGGRNFLVGVYVGATQFLAALAYPPHLLAICPAVTASNYHDGWTYQGGAFEQWFNDSWTTGFGGKHHTRRRSEAGEDFCVGKNEVA